MRGVARKSLISSLLVIFILVTLIFTTSCNRKYNEDEVVEVTENLLKQAEMLNFVYYGAGISFIDGDDTTGYYKKASYNHLTELGFYTIDELKVRTDAVFSSEYASLIYSTLLSTVYEDTGPISAARYYQAYDEQSGEPTHIMVYSVYEPLMRDSVVYNYDSISVIGAKKEIVKVSVEATVTTSDGKTQTATVVINLVEEEDGWRIDNPTYVNYNDSLDRYNELQDQEIK